MFIHPNHIQVSVRRPVSDFYEFGDSHDQRMAAREWSQSTAAALQRAGYDWDVDTSTKSSDSSWLALSARVYATIHGLDCWMVGEQVRWHEADFSPAIATAEALDGGPIGDADFREAVKTAARLAIGIALAADESGMETARREHESENADNERLAGLFGSIFGR